MNYFKTFVLFSLSAITFNCSNDSGIKVEIIDGIKTTTNPVQPKFANRKFFLENEFVFGDKEGEGVIDLPFIIAVNKSNKIYVYDYIAKAVKIFNKDGSFEKKIGREGNGPGEFMYPRKIVFVNENTFLMNDPGNNRISIFEDDAFKNSINIPNIGLDIFPSSQNSFYILRKRNPQNLASTSSLFRYNLDGQILDSITNFESAHQHKLEMGKGGAIISIPFAPSPKFEVSNLSNELFYSFTDEYKIKAFVNGKLSRVFGRQFDQIKINDEDKNSLKINIAVGNQIVKYPTSKINFPEFKGVFNSITIDDKNNFWIETFEKKMVKEIVLTAYDKFDSEGIYEAKIWLESKPEVIKNNYLYTFHRDKESGNTLLKRYKIKWVD